MRPNNWGGQDGTYWAANDLRYDTILGRHSPHLLAGGDPRPGERVLDVGCGCGNATRQAGRRAGDVLGVDLSAAMLAKARQRTAEAGLTNVRYARADAQTAAFAPVDLVMSQFGIMFFDDPPAAFANLRRAGRRLAFLCWQGLEENENRYVVREALSPYVDVPPPRPKGALSLADPDHVRDLLGAAGFTGIEVHDVREPLNVGRDADDAVEFAVGEPQTSQLLADAGPDRAGAATEALRKAFAAHETPEGVLLGSAAWLVTAR